MKKLVICLALATVAVSCKKIQAGGNKNIIKLEEVQKDILMITKVVQKLMVQLTKRRLLHMQNQLKMLTELKLQKLILLLQRNKSLQKQSTNFLKIKYMNPAFLQDFFVETRLNFFKRN